MALNRSPLRAVSQEDIDTYERDGAVVLRNVCSPDWIEMLLPVAKRIAIQSGLQTLRSTTAPSRS